MDYLFENLGPERFQEFCQSLINKEYPNTQSFPVGQPDGGRDSISYFDNGKEFIIFQVKFVRNPHKMQDPHKWLTDIIDDEIDKIKTLIPKGALSFILITNVSGTSHLDAGSIDILQKTLDDKLPIPGRCWWRGDLARLIENDISFRWSFPQILNGQDILNSAMFSISNENNERRERIVKAYLTDQYELDNEVKFRQINLTNELLDLYTDVPIQLKKYNPRNKNQVIEINKVIHSISEDYYYEGPYYIDNSKPIVGASEFLFHPSIQKLQRLLLEGGPGQGKSTISQYICQIHRVQLLNKTNDLSILPEEIQNVPIRLPIKIDLRHLSSWIEKKNPYAGKLSDEKFKQICNKSLESFLVGHIIYHSQFDDFTTNDMFAIFKQSPVLIVFDGFDEIANFNLRGDVIELINEGYTRVSANSLSLQIIVTSRPAAFTDAVGFPSDVYPHFELVDVDTDFINDYVEKWNKASNLSSRRASEIKKLVKDKLELPHLRDLARSPMQLAIFLNLLNTRGESLPNKRTALYDSYIDLFFSREAEKSTLIRDKRDLIIEIHEYLAWVLHSEAELYKNNGSIGIDVLKERLKDFLLKEGQKTEIADQLFDVMKERVCALVSRVQGTFEFEVQPLREYFCAKYLYKTSAHSPVGNEKPGSLPDRFDAISQNFYWQNVLRFFSGCFSKGDLPMLILKLQELEKHETLKYTNYPRILTSQILSDYVFSQYPLFLKDVVKIIISGIHSGNIIGQETDWYVYQPIFVPEDCGRDEILDECFEQLRKFPPIEYAFELIGLIKNNRKDLMTRWESNLNSKWSDQEKTTWYNYGYHLELLHQIDENKLVEYLLSSPETELSKRLKQVIYSRKSEIFDNDLKLKEIVVNKALDQDIWFNASLPGSIKFIGLIFNSNLYSGILDSYYEKHSTILSFYRSIGKRRARMTGQVFEFEVNDDFDQKAADLLSKIREGLDADLKTLKTDISFADNLVENARKIYGDRWLFKTYSITVAGYKERSQVFEEHEDLHNSELSLCKRVRHARMKSGQISYWEKQLEKKDKLFTLSILLTWGTAKTIVALRDTIEKELELLSPTDLTRIITTVNINSDNSRFNSIQLKTLEEECQNKRFNNRLLYPVFLRATNGDKLINKYYNHDSSSFDELKVLKVRFLIINLLKQPNSDEKILDEIKEAYSEVKFVFEHLGQLAHSITDFEKQTIQMNIEIARKIMSDCNRYPRAIVAAAELKCRNHALETIIPVGEIALRDKWFA